MAAAACGGGAKKAQDAAGGGGSAPGAPPTTPAGHAIAAFVRGTWQVSMTPEPNYNMNFRTVTVTDGRWNATAPRYVDAENGIDHVIDESGTYSLAGGKLTVSMDSSSRDMTASDVPDQVSDPAKAMLSWNPGSSDAFPLDIAWDGTTLTIRGKQDFVLKAVRA
ncbi:MAG: hypothetical protein HOV66_22420 [Streptomycetaceae bacterium]|jgi:hypothetical protein|nr:hypothetical protein [Streptomycetaceae bacterium]